MLVVVGLVGAPSSAVADGQARETMQLSGFFGVRTSSELSSLGTPTTTSVGNSLGLGPRLRIPVWSSLSVEAELGIFPSSTRTGNVSVTVFDPRAQVVFAFREREGFRPMLLAGIGGPLAVSGNSDVLRTSVQVEGYAGAAVAFSRGGGLSFRLDLRGHFGPGRDDSAIAPGLEVLIGISYRRKTKRELGLPPSPEELDRDGDGISDADDKCPDRPEDKDGFQDADGCPDIDDDGDEILDVADRCRMEPETYNGYKDSDGCPDSLPDDLAAIVGVVENVWFYPRSARLHRRSRRPLRKVVAVLGKYKGVRINVIAHTDNQGDENANVELSGKRAKAIKTWLVGAGVGEERITTTGRGGAQPLYDNDTAKNRFKNNRIEIKLVHKKR